MSNIIEQSEYKKQIELIILECKFGGLGSKIIQDKIKGSLGLEFSRPTIDKYYKEVLNGDFLSEKIEELKRGSLMGGSDDGFQIPLIDMEKLNDIRAKYVNKGNGTANKIEELKECLALLIDSNFNAFIEGKERLKIEYVKYLKDLEHILKSNSQ